MTEIEGQKQRQVDKYEDRTKKKEEAERKRAKAKNAAKVRISEKRSESRIF